MMDDVQDSKPTPAHFGLAAKVGMQKIKDSKQAWEVAAAEPEDLVVVVREASEQIIGTTGKGRGFFGCLKFKLYLRRLDAGNLSLWADYKGRDELLGLVEITKHNLLLGHLCRPLETNKYHFCNVEEWREALAAFLATASAGKRLHRVLYGE